MTGQDHDYRFDEDEFGGDEPSQPWHNSTGAVAGASVAGLAVIGVLVGAVMLVTGQDGPEAPATFVDPSFSTTASAGPTTTTPTTSRTTPLSTTEINAPPTSPTTSGSSDSSSSESRSFEATTRPRQRDNDDGPATTRNRPRTNITRTLLPQQAG